MRAGSCPSKLRNRKGSEKVIKLFENPALFCIMCHGQRLFLQDIIDKGYGIFCIERTLRDGRRGLHGRTVPGESFRNCRGGASECAGKEGKMKILIADDESYIRMGLASMDWAGQGITLAGAAANGPEVLRYLENEKIDILLTDIRMPGMSGLELVRQVGEMQPEIKCILLTGYGEFEYAQDAIRLGVFDYLLKPCDPEQIFACVNRAVKALEEERSHKKKLSQLQNEVKNYQILSELNLFQKGEGQQEEALIELIMKYMKEHFGEEIFLKDLAEYTHFSSGYLSKFIKEKTGQNFIAILTRMRVTNAAWLLVNTELRNYEIAERVGIPDERYFSQVFKKYYGMTPLQYRKEKQNRTDVENWVKAEETDEG